MSGVVDGGDMKTVHSSGVRGAEAAMAHREVTEQVFDFNNEEWKLCTRKSTILASHCYCAVKKKQVVTMTNARSRSSDQGQDHEPESSVSESVILTTTTNTEIPVSSPISAPAGSESNPRETVPAPDLCHFCRFSSELQLTHYPEMVFPDNILHLVHTNTGFVIEFNALDAMRSISTTTSPIQVACSEHWRASRAFIGLTETVIEPFDWTYSTEYCGTLRTSNLEPPQVQSEPQEVLDLEKLKQREKILFYDEMTLYEDELHDNGVSTLSVKIRVMPSGFFILLRFFLRVDNVLIKLHDTRIYFEVGNNYFLQQFQTREQTFNKLEHLEGSILGDPNLVYPYLPVTREVNEKVVLL